MVLTKTGSLFGALLLGGVLAGVPNFSAMKCEACEAVVDELDTTLRAEAFSIEGRQDLLAGGRLDSKGKRQGRVVNYAMSELRAMEVLERLCEGVMHYRTVENDGGAGSAGGAGKFWFSKMETYHDRGTVEIPEKEHEENNKRSLKNFCGELVEEHEELLTKMIQRFKPSVVPAADGKPGGQEETRDWLVSTPLHKELCVDNSKHCASAYLKGGLGWYRKDPIYQLLLVRNTKAGELLPRFGDAPQRTAGSADLTGDTKARAIDKAMENALADAKKLAGGNLADGSKAGNAATTDDEDSQQKVQDAVNKLKKKGGGKKKRKKRKKKKASKKKAAAAKEEL